MFWHVLMILLLGAGVTFYQVPALVRRGHRRELAAFSVFLMLGVALAATLALGLPVPNPTRGIEVITDSLTRLLYPASVR